MASAVGSTRETSMPNSASSACGKIPRLAVAVIREDDMAVTAHVGHQRHDYRAHAGGKQHRPLGAFDSRQLAFTFLLGRVAVAAVFVLAHYTSLAFGLHELQHLGGGVEVVVGGLDDRRGDRIMRLWEFGPVRE